jgi:hypothetical protein
MATKINETESRFGKGVTADARRVPLFADRRFRVPRFRVLKRFASRGPKPISIMSEIGHRADGIRFISVALRPLSFEREDSHVANIQADADLHTLQTHHRDAVHNVRRADAASIVRAARPQLQFADL